MNIKNSSYFNKASTIISLSIILGTVTYAWTGPTETAPNGNVPAPINVGTLLQEKMGALKVRGSFTITGGNKGYSELTQDADDASTLVTKSYVDNKVATAVSTGNSSPYCAFSGQSKSIQAGDSPNFQFKVATCVMSVDSSGFQTITVSGGNIDFTKCSETRNNQDSLSCSFTSMYDTQASANVSFDRNTGVMTCVYSDPSGGGTHTNTFTFAKDQSKCVGSSSESDPTVLASVKDGVSWSEVTGKPAISSVPSGAVFIMTSCPSGWTQIGNWGTIQDQTGIGGINVYQCQAP